MRKAALQKWSMKVCNRLILFLSDAKEREGCGLMWTAASEISSEHMGEGVKAVNGI